MPMTASLTRQNKESTELHIIQLDQECINVTGYLNCQYDLKKKITHNDK